MYRILFLADDAARLRERALRLAEHLASRGWHAEAMARGASSCMACRAGFAATMEPPGTGRQFGLFGFVRRLRAAVSAGRYDLVHLVSPGPGRLVRFALAGLRSPRPRIIHDALGPELSDWGQALAARWTDHIVTRDYTSYTRASNRFLLPAGQTHYIPAPGSEAPEGYWASWDALYALALGLPEAAPRPTERTRAAYGRPRWLAASALPLAPR